jgi:hypothetical protein
MNAIRGLAEKHNSCWNGFERFGIFAARVFYAENARDEPNTAAGFFQFDRECPSQDFRADHRDGGFAPRLGERVWRVPSAFSRRSLALSRKGVL